MFAGPGRTGMIVSGLTLEKAIKVLPMQSGCYFFLYRIMLKTARLGNREGSKEPMKNRNRQTCRFLSRT